MNARTTLLALAGVVALAGVIGVVAAPGALDDPRDTDAPPGNIDLVDVIVDPGEIRGETATLDLVADLEHQGSTVENVTVRHRAIGSESGLLVDETTVEVGDVDQNGEMTVNGSVDVDRAGGYHLETVVYVDGERRTERTTRVAGVSALVPSYADANVGFSDSDIWPTVAVSVAETSEESATLSISTAVANRGDDPSENLELRVLLRQADSNVVADETSETVGSVRPGRTEAVTTTVEVPDGYNYYVDAALFDDDVLIDETQDVANLDPQETIDANETVEDVDFAVEDFAQDDVADDSEDAPRGDVVEDEDDADADEDTPGFGVAVAAAALILATLIARRVQ